MKVYIVHTAEYGCEPIPDVVAWLRRFAGPLRFLPLDCPFPAGAPVGKLKGADSSHNGAPALSFSRLDRLRQEKRIGNNDFVLGLTCMEGGEPWPLVLDRQGCRNVLVDMGYWEGRLDREMYTNAVAYHLAVAPLVRLLFEDQEEMRGCFRFKAEGFLMDYVRNAAQMSLKLRTGDIAAESLKRIREKEVPAAMTRQVFRILDAIRERSLNRRRFEPGQLSPLKIAGRNYRFFLTGMHDMEVRLTPLEKVVYLFFLSRPEGVCLPEMPDYRRELYSLYRSLSREDNRDVALQRIDLLVAPLSNSLNEKIARIKQKFVKALGPELARHYYIQGPKAGKKRIALDRGLVQWPREEQSQAIHPCPHQRILGIAA
jgi:hypothetical protein